MRKAIKYGYYKNTEPTAKELLEHADYKLFMSALHNSNHVLRQLLPPKREVSYALRGSWHGRSIDEKDDRNFVNRMLFMNIY